MKNQLRNNSTLEEIRNELTCIEKVAQDLFEKNKCVKNYIQSLQTNNETFKKYYNSFKGRKIVLVGSGPTAKKHIQIPDAIYIGVNNACLLEQIQFDFLFCQDFYMSQELQDRIVDYRNENCIKFFGIIPDVRFAQCKVTPEAMHVRRGYKRYYDIGYPYYISELYENNTVDDISTEPLMADGIIFCAMQFALYGHPDCIYLVGCDCTKGFFYESKKEFDNTYMIHLWKKIRDMKNELYPDVSVVSINPVGLKEMFEDIYI